MWRGLIGALVLAMTTVGVLAWPAWAQPPETSPRPFAVAEAMRPCLHEPVTIAPLGAPREFPEDAQAVIVNSADGTFAIKELTVMRAAGAAAVMVTRDPSFALLHVTFPEWVGNGWLDTDHDEFQRRVVDCFYGAYLGQDIL